MKRKVLIFIEDGSFTFDNRVLREASALVEAGWTVTVISPKYSNDPYYKKLSDHLRAYYYPKPTAESTLGHIVEHSISLLLRTPLTFWVFLRHGFSVFHACNPMDILWMIALPYKLLGRCFVFDQHDLCPELYLSRGDQSNRGFMKALLGLEQASYRHADAVITTNETYKEIAIDRGHKKNEEVFVVRNAPDLVKFCQVPAREGLKRPGGVLVLGGYLGNMNLEDGVDYLIDAAADIVTKRGRSDVSFVFIGGGSQWEKLVQQARTLGLGESTRFTGRVTDAEMLATLCACDVCVQPDPSNLLNDKSTMNKALEYMALEKPVVSFDLKETRVSCGDAALYASGHTPAALADEILTLADNANLRRELGRRGRARVEEQLCWARSVPNLLAAYEHAIR